MQNKNKNKLKPVSFARRGFTLVEMMVVVAVFAIVTTIGVANYNKSKDQRELEASAQYLSAVLREARTMAQTGQTFPELSDKRPENGLGVYIKDNKSYILFANQGGEDDFSYDEDDSSGVDDKTLQEYELPGHVVFEDNSGELGSRVGEAFIFTADGGMYFSSGVIKLKLDYDDEVFRCVRINQETGKIESGDCGCEIDTDCPDDGTICNDTMTATVPVIYSCNVTTGNCEMTSEAEAICTSTDTDFFCGDADGGLTGDTHVCSPIAECAYSDGVGGCVDSSICVACAVGRRCESGSCVDDALTEECGDNTREGSEQCDGTDTPTDYTCSDSCKLQQDVSCETPSGDPSSWEWNGLSSYTQTCNTYDFGASSCSEWLPEIDTEHYDETGTCHYKCAITYRWDSDEEVCKTYCGNGVTEDPNGEGVSEECDGSASVCGAGDYVCSSCKCDIRTCYIDFYVRKGSEGGVFVTPGDASAPEWKRYYGKDGDIQDNHSSLGFLDYSIWGSYRLLLDPDEDPDGIDFKIFPGYNSVGVAIDELVLGDNLLFSTTESQGRAGDPGSYTDDDGFYNLSWEDHSSERYYGLNISECPDVGAEISNEVGIYLKVDSQHDVNVNVSSDSSGTGTFSFDFTYPSRDRLSPNCFWTNSCNITMRRYAQATLKIEPDPGYCVSRVTGPGIDQSFPATVDEVGCGMQTIEISPTQYMNIEVEFIPEIRTYELSICPESDIGLGDTGVLHNAGVIAEATLPTFDYTVDSGDLSDYLYYSWNNLNLDHSDSCVMARFVEGSQVDIRPTSEATYSDHVIFWEWPTSGLCSSIADDTCTVATIYSDGLVVYPKFRRWVNVRMTSHDWGGDYFPEVIIEYSRNDLSEFSDESGALVLPASSPNPPGSPVEALIPSYSEITISFEDSPADGYALDQFRFYEYGGSIKRGYSTPYNPYDYASWGNIVGSLQKDIEVTNYFGIE